jgi:hypothetical protein
MSLPWVCKDDHLTLKKLVRGKKKNSDYDHVLQVVKQVSPRTVVAELQYLLNLLIFRVLFRFPYLSILFCMLLYYSRHYQLLFI